MTGQSCVCRWWECASAIHPTLATWANTLLVSLLCRNSSLHGFELHRPSSKGTKFLLQVIKAIINQLASSVNLIMISYTILQLPNLLFLCYFGDCWMILILSKHSLFVLSNWRTPGPFGSTALAHLVTFALIRNLPLTPLRNFTHAHRAGANRTRPLWDACVKNLVRYSIESLHDSFSQYESYNSLFFFCEGQGLQ